MDMVRYILHFFNTTLCEFYLRARRWKIFLKKNHKERIVVSMTSWSKRINNVSATIESILHNTTKPDFIVLNLSLVEFPKKEIDLPVELCEYIDRGVVEVLWHERNDKAFKKFIPTMRKYPHDAIIAIDDDFIYPDDFIETFVTKHKKYPKSPLSGNKFKINNRQAHCGCASLVKYEYFGDVIDTLLDDEIINLRLDDYFYTYCAAIAGRRYKHVGKLFFLNMLPNNPIEGLTENTNPECYAKINKYIVDKIKRIYYVNTECLDTPTFVNPFSLSGKFFS